MTDVKGESFQMRGRRGRKPSNSYFDKVRMEFVEEVSVLQKISQLRKEGRWEKRLPKVCEPPKERCLWDIVIEEAVWVSSELVRQRKWRRAVAKKSSNIMKKHIQEKELKQHKAEKNEDAQKIKAAAGVAKLVKTFWSNVQTLVEFRDQTISRKRDLDQRLSHLVNETEKYSEIVAQSFTDNFGNYDEESKPVSYASSSSQSSVISTSNSSSKPASSPSSVLSKRTRTRPLSSGQLNDDDGEFIPPSDYESDVDDTIAEEEAKENKEAPDHKNELDDLEAENNMSIEELLAKYAKLVNNPDAYKEPEPEIEVIKPKPPKKSKLAQAAVTRRSGRPLKIPQRLGCLQRGSNSDEEDQKENSSQSIYSADEADSDFSQDEDDETSGSEANKSNEDLESLIKSMSSQDNEQKSTTTAEEQTNKLADLAESFKPKGNTLSSTTVVTKVPFLLRHSLREYQHIGLDWLVTMYKKRLNGILADEMGLGKTIQTIALLAYLAVEQSNWGPHLIIVPTSVMLNWEMEFMKWCPGFKILTYYGSQKERKLKRTGWTKPNSFHVCIVSYKLVIQDHQSFRRKRWKYLILDEAQNIKNFKSQRWQLLLNFNSQRRLLLTGTPLQNNLMELWSLLHFLMPNVFQSHMEFKDWFSNPMSGMVEGSQEYNEDIVRRLHKVIRPFILRRMKNEVEKQLPQKHEHVIMCALSKRQRYLYDEFMLRTQTQDTLNQGNLLSVIGILMQLRKVCNHPNLFETRPIISPFQTEGINYQLPALVWDVLRDSQEDSFHQYSPFFNVSNASNVYSEYDTKLIQESRPLFIYNPKEEKRHYVLNSIKYEGIGKPPVKRSTRIVNLSRDEPPPCPRLLTPFQLILSSNPANGDYGTEFMEDIESDAVPSSPLKSANNSQQSQTSYVESQETISTEFSACSVEDSDFTDLMSEYDPSNASQSQRSGSDAEDEAVFCTKRKIVAGRRLEISERLELMECTVHDLELDFIQERKLQDRKLVVNNLNMTNMYRCNALTSANCQLVETCQVVGSLPKLRLTCKSGRCRVSFVNKERSRNYKENGYFNLGWKECMKIIRVRQEDPNLMNNPVMLWSTTKYLDSAIKSPQARVDELKSVFTRFVMYIPAVSAPSLKSLVYRPSSSARYFTDLGQADQYRKRFVKCTDIVHPVVSRMLTQFPDPRLIQYDCGKLQTLDLLLRRLKSESHRVLIFTQMAKVLDILEAFLTYHGHTYLRLDGATKIDQRQLLMERFNADKKIFCFILSTRSGGVGVNLTGADTVIFYDSDWNPTMDAQAQDRCHRIGQTRDVHIYRLVSEKTVEENILKKSNQKRLLGELAIEGGKFTTTFFKEQTIRDLFTINEKEDVTKRLTAWNTNGSSLLSNETEYDLTVDSTDFMQTPQTMHGIKMLECALAAAEDDRDVEAAQTVHAETEAEFAEFDEDGLVDVNDKKGPTKFELEYQQLYELMTDIERYALRSVESWIEDWYNETHPQA